MKLHTPSAPKPPEPKSILLLGPPGAGKTTFSLQFPSPLVMDCDGNLDGPTKFITKAINKDLAYAYESINCDDNDKEIPVEAKYDRLDAKLKAARTSDCKTIIVDSMTMVNEFIIRKVLKQQNQPAMRAIDWQPLKSLYWNLLVSGIRASGKDTIVTCHEVILTEPSAGNMMKENIIGYKPSVQGGISDYFGAFFTDIWRCEVRQTPKGNQHVIVTAKTSKSPDLKNSLGLPSELPALYSEIQKYL